MVLPVTCQVAPEEGEETPERMLVLLALARKSRDPLGLAPGESAPASVEAASALPVLDGRPLDLANLVWLMA